MKGNIIVLDIETTGDNYLVDEICQMSYLILDNDFNIVSHKNFFFKVDYVYFKSNKRKLNIDKLAELSNNKRFEDNYDEIFRDLNNGLIIAHNIEHDINYINSEFLRVNNKNTFIYDYFCTMEHYTNILKIETDRGYKYPKLIEIMPHLNIKRGDIFTKAKDIFEMEDSEIDFHDSRVDCMATYLVAIKTKELINKIEVADISYINKINEDEFKENNVDYNDKYELDYEEYDDTKEKYIERKRFKIPKFVFVVILILFMFWGFNYLENYLNESSDINIEEDSLRTEVSEYLSELCYRMNEEQDDFTVDYYITQSGMYMLRINYLNDDCNSYQTENKFLANSMWSQVTNLHFDDLRTLSKNFANEMKYEFGIEHTCVKLTHIGLDFDSGNQVDFIARNGVIDYYDVDNSQINHM